MDKHRKKEIDWNCFFRILPKTLLKTYSYFLVTFSKLTLGDKLIPRMTMENLLKSGNVKL